MGEWNTLKARYFSYLMISLKRISRGILLENSSLAPGQSEIDFTPPDSGGALSNIDLRGR